MIMAFSFNKLFPRIPTLSPKTQFIKIKLVNLGLDLLNISNIFRDHIVTSKIPQYFENLDPPLICYQYNTPIRSIIFNYNQVTSDLILMFWFPFSHHDLVRTRRFFIHLLGMLSLVTLLVFLTKDYGHSLRKGLNIDFHPGLILLNAGILSRIHLDIDMVRFARCCTSVFDFHSKNLQITSKLLTQGYRYHKLRKTLKKNKTSLDHTPNSVEIFWYFVPKFLNRSSTVI